MLIGHLSYSYAVLSLLMHADRFTNGQPSHLSNTFLVAEKRHVSHSKL